MVKNVDGFDVNSISEKTLKGHIFQIDLEYPQELHVHNDDPLAPEKLAILYEMLLDYWKNIADEYGIKIGNVMKLILNLGNKTNKVFLNRTCL